MLGYKYTQFVEYLKGCFIGDQSRPDLEGHIFLLTEYESSEEYLRFEQNLTRSRFFVERYDPDNYSVMYVYRVPPEYLEDYRLFKASKYSAFSDEYKRKIIKFWDFLATHKYFKVLYKDVTRKEELEEDLGITLLDSEELLSAIDLKKEIYNDDFKVINPLVASLTDSFKKPKKVRKAKQAQNE